jgi:hypothetical protein
MQDLIAAGAEDAIQRVFVYKVDGIPALSRWQASLVEKLNSDANGVNEKSFPDPNGT